MGRPVVHWELWSENPEGIGKFYEKVFDWNVRHVPDLNYRLVETEGMSVFTALQRRGVPSKFVVFPDENHWVLKPRNSVFWYDTVLAWIDRYTK